MTLRPALLVTALVGLGCGEAPRTYETKVRVLQAQRVGGELLDLELKFSECPGDARRVVRADHAFVLCAGAIKAGDELPASLSHGWNAERGSYRAEFTKIGACVIKPDPTEEANYELVQVCTDLKATGATVGVHCDRTRPKELIAKCPWLRRK